MVSESLPLNEAYKPRVSPFRQRVAAGVLKLARVINPVVDTRRYGRECHFPSGYVGEYPHVAVDTIVTREKLGADGKPVKQILLIKRSETSATFPGHWALPGGYFEINEQDGIPAAAARELAEETGITGARLYPVIIMDKRQKEKDPDGNVSHVFWAHIDGTASADAPDELTTNDPDEISNARWFDIDKLPPELAFDHGDIVRFFFSIEEQLRAQRLGQHVLPIYFSQVGAPSAS